MAFAKPKNVATPPTASERTMSGTSKNPYKMSGWTPTSSRAANENMFNDRRELLKKWFSGWSSKQKQLVLKDMLDSADVHFHKHVHDTVLARHGMVHE